MGLNHDQSQTKHENTVKCRQQIHVHLFTNTSRPVNDVMGTYGQPISFQQIFAESLSKKLRIHGGHTCEKPV